MDAGFPADAVNTIRRSRKTGITRDIIKESEKGCSAVVVGRKNVGTLPDFMLGSIAAKLAESIAHVPLVIVGGQPEPTNVLVAFDRSRYIRKGLRNVSSLFSRALEEISFENLIPLASMASYHLPYGWRRYFSPTFIHNGSCPASFEAIMPAGVPYRLSHQSPLGVENKIPITSPSMENSTRPITTGMAGGEVVFSNAPGG